MLVTKENFKSIRVNGIGSNFKVLNPEDGYRKDNRLWFGECAECGERVTNSSLNGIWKHEIVLSVSYHASGTIASKSSKQVDYCPKA